MLQGMICRLGIGLLLLSSMLAFAWLLPNTDAIASDGPAGAGRKIELGSSLQDGPPLETPGQSHVTLENVCRVKGEGQNIFTKDGNLTLELDEAHAGYRMANEVAESLNGPQVIYQNNSRLVAKALDSANIELVVPDQYRDDAVTFISQILSLRVPRPGPVGPAAASVSSVQRARKYTPIVPNPHRGEGTTLQDICRVRGEGQNIYTKDGKLTLVIDRVHAGFRKANEIAEAINRPQVIVQNSSRFVAKALDASNIEVTVPSQYHEAPVCFISQILSLPIVVD